MKKLLFVLFTLPIFGIAQNTVCFTIDTNPVNGIAFSGFTKYVDVLGCFFIVAESTIPDAKVLHAAAVAAELLDNNEDGIVDDPLIELQLQNKQAFTPIFAYEGSSAEDLLFNNYQGDGASAVLYNNEIDPAQTGHWGDDATVEEVIHTINHVGHTNIYPNAFSLQPYSSLMSNAMDVARGGQFLSIPNPYPSTAWYHYDDWTCDYECMMIEYMYWAIVSYMGILDDAQTRTKNGYLIPSQKSVNYFLVIKDKCWRDTKESFLRKLRATNDILLVFELDLEKTKNSDRFIIHDKKN